jgi:hypothetical protein
VALGRVEVGDSVDAVEVAPRVVEIGSPVDTVEVERVVGVVSLSTDV